MHDCSTKNVACLKRLTQTTLSDIKVLNNMSNFLNLVSNNNDKLNIRAIDCSTM